MTSPLDGPSPDSDIDEEKLAEALRHAFSQEDKDTAERNLEPGMSVDYRDGGPFWVNSINGDGTVELYSGPETQAYASVPAEDCTVKSDYSLQGEFPCRPWQRHQSMVRERGKEQRGHRGGPV